MNDLFHLTAIWGFSICSSINAAFYYLHESLSQDGEKKIISKIKNLIIVFKNNTISNFFLPNMDIYVTITVSKILNSKYLMFHLQL